MGTTVVETNYRRFAPVGQDDKCESCPSGCKTSCVRLLAVEHETDMEKDFEGFKVTFGKEDEEL